MSKEEGRYYICEKLKGAGCRQSILEDGAIEAIRNAADGTPRLINKYCNTSMLLGDSSRADLITTDIVMRAINDCELGCSFSPHAFNLHGGLLDVNKMQNRLHSICVKAATSG